MSGARDWQPVLPGKEYAGRTVRMHREQTTRTPSAVPEPKRAWRARLSATVSRRSSDLAPDHPGSAPGRQQVLGPRTQRRLAEPERVSLTTMAEATGKTAFHVKHGGIHTSAREAIGFDCAGAGSRRVLAALSSRRSGRRRWCFEQRLGSLLLTITENRQHAGYAGSATRCRTTHNAVPRETKDSSTASATTRCRQQEVVRRRLSRRVPLLRSSSARQFRARRPPAQR